jgi:hypothetical protein
MSEAVTNRKFIDIDTLQSVDNYIDEICSDPDFLCRNEQHKEMCGKNTTIYASIDNVNNICENIKQANICENDIKECVVLADNTLEGSQKFVSTSFSNIIIPIPKAFDKDGNEKFIRLPSLSSTRKKNSNEICSVCACMDRFARSPGSGFNDYTSPRQNKCVFGDKFQYYYYPVYIQQIRDKIKDSPPVVLGGKKVVNTNIIHISTDNDLLITKLYEILIENGISETITYEFLTNVLYGDNEQSLKELKAYLINKKKKKTSTTNKSSFGKGGNSNFFYILIIIVIFLFYIL